MLINLNQVRTYSKKARESQKEFLVKHWNKMTRQEFKERFTCGNQYLNELIKEVKRSGQELLDKRKNYDK